MKAWLASTSASQWETRWKPLLWPCPNNARAAMSMTKNMIRIWLTAIARMINSCRQNDWQLSSKWLTAVAKMIDSCHQNDWQFDRCCQNDWHLSRKWLTAAMTMDGSYQEYWLTAVLEGDVCTKDFSLHNRMANDKFWKWQDGSFFAIKKKRC